MKVALSYDPSLTGYDLGEGHPMQPERFSLAVALIEAWGLADRFVRLEPADIDDDVLALVHTRDLIAAVKAAGSGRGIDPGFGIGPGDTPAFPGMYEATVLAVAATCAAVDAVSDGRTDRAFAPGGGLHHAHRDRAAGFCVFNDVAIAIERAVRAHPGLRVAYVDVDAHHGDGVQEAFEARSDVLTLSVHESGRYLYPGTGATTDVGRDEGRGFAINVPLPPGSGDAAYSRVAEQVIAPALARFGPDLIVAQLGGDTHVGDPLTHLALTVAGYDALVARLVQIADDVAGGRIVATGGGGYQPYDEVPRMWACAAAELAGVEVPAELPEEWLYQAEAASGGRRPLPETFSERTADGDAPLSAPTGDEIDRVIDAVRGSSDLLR